MEGDVSRLGRLSRSIEGRVAVVTGAGSGMGRATAMVFADDSSFGHEAALCTRSPEMNAGLTAPAWLQTARAGRNWIRSALTYPARHGWIGRQ